MEERLVGASGGCYISGPTYAFKLKIGLVTVDDTELLKLQKYLNEQFGTKSIRVKKGRTKGAAEVELKDEFIGTIYRDEEEGEISYSFTMSILDIDLGEE